MRTKAPFLLLCFLSGCVTAQPVSPLEFSCGDVVVVGRIKTVGATPVQGSDPLPNWLSEYQLQIQIKRIIRGSEHRRVVPASVTAHAQIRGDRDFLIVLTPDGAGGYALATADLMQFRPKLSESCS